MRCNLCNQMPKPGLYGGWQVIFQYDSLLAKYVTSYYACKQCCLSFQNGTDEAPFKECHACNRKFVVKTGEYRQYKNNIVCPSCYKSCDNCGGVGLFQHGDYLDPNQTIWVCKGCYRLDEIVRDFSEDVLDYLDFMGIGPRFLGVELELVLAPNKASSEKEEAYLFANEVTRINGLIKDWGILKDDGSLPFYSFELVSRPASLYAHLQQWKTLLPELATNFTVGNTCGLHIHASRCLSPKQEFKLFTFMHSKANTEFLSTIAGRDLRDPHCSFFAQQRSLEYLLKFYNIANGEIRPQLALYENDEEDVGDEIDHHAALSRQAQTVEFRIFKATTDFEVIARNLEFVDSLCEFVQSDCSLLDSRADHFVKWLMRIKGYPHLKTFFKQHKELARR